jgi:hypothetical protein
LRVIYHCDSSFFQLLDMLEFIPSHAAVCLVLLLARIYVVSS